MTSLMRTPSPPSQSLEEDELTLHSRHHDEVPVAATSAATSSFFARERSRLMKEIADGLENLMGDTNELNRNLEQAIAVGQQFEPVAALWGRFAETMAAAGVAAPEEDAGQATSGASGAGTDGDKGSSEQAGGQRSLGASAGAQYNSDKPDLPRGVAPGGGTVYGRQG